MKIELQNVKYMPKELEQGILYVSIEYGAVAHLCACGCGSKIRTPLGPTEWKLTETPKGPSLSPSVGSWQLKCKSHYWIKSGEIKWSNQWTDAQIISGRQSEQKRRETYYNDMYVNSNFWKKLWVKFKNIVGLS